MIKKRSTLIILIVLLATLFCYIFSPIKAATNENKVRATEEWEDSGFIDPTAHEEAAFHRLVDLSHVDNDII